MPNNITAPGVGDVLATELIASAHLSRMKLVLGASGTDSGDVSATNPIPVTASTNLPVAVAAALPAGDNNIGNVDIVTLPTLPAGTNNIGDVDVLTLPMLPAGTNNIGDVDVLTLPATPAGTNLIGKVAAGIDLGTVYNGAVAATMGRVASVLTATTNTVYTPGSGKKVRVLSLLLIPLGNAVTTRVFLGTTNDKVGTSANPIPLDKTGSTGLPGLLLPYNPAGWFEGVADELLKVTNGSTEPVQLLAQVVEI